MSIDLHEEEKYVYSKIYEKPNIYIFLSLAQGYLISVRTMGVRGPLYLGHSKCLAERIPLLQIPDPSLIQIKVDRVFHSSDG